MFVETLGWIVMMRLGLSDRSLHSLSPRRRNTARLATVP